jgi:hypothetical protein
VVRIPLLMVRVLMVRVLMVWVVEDLFCLVLGCTKAAPIAWFVGGYLVILGG